MRRRAFMRWSAFWRSRRVVGTGADTAWTGRGAGADRVSAAFGGVRRFPAAPGAARGRGRGADNGFAGARAHLARPGVGPALLASPPRSAAARPRCPLASRAVSLCSRSALDSGSVCSDSARSGPTRRPREPRRSRRVRRPGAGWCPAALRDGSGRDEAAPGTLRSPRKRTTRRRRTTTMPYDCAHCGETVSGGAELREHLFGAHPALVGRRATDRSDQP